MTAQEEFEIEKADFKKRALKKARIQSIILGLSTVVAILGVMYGLINRIEVQTQRELATFNEQQAIQAKQEANEARITADKQSENHKDQIETLRSQLEACGARNVKDAQQTCGKALAAAETMVQANLERAVKAEADAKRSQQISQAYQKKAEQEAIELKKQLEQCKSGK